MTSLFLDNKMADIKKDSSFKYTRSNMFFTEDGDYTLDVSLPFTPNNLQIFGVQNRLDANKNKLANKQFAFRLQADHLLFTGSAIVTSVTQDEVKIQLLAGRSELKIKSEDDQGNPIYIDDLVLPKAYEEQFRAIFGYAKEYTMWEAISMLLRQTTMFFDPVRAMYGSPDETNCLCFPIYSEADSTFANQRCLARFFDLNGGEYSDWWTWELSDKTQDDPLTGSEYMVPEELVLAPQPYLFYIVEQIFEAMGYTVVENFIRNSWMKYIFIANARGVLDLNMILPHWTITDFIHELEQFCGVKVILQRGNKIYIIDKDRYRSQSVVPITQVVDAFQVDFEEKEDTELINVGNVQYAYPDSLGYLILPDNVFERAKTESWGTYDELYDYYQTLTDEQIKASDTLYEVGNDRYASINPGTGGWALYQVDQMGQLQRQSYRDTDISLRIVPIRTTHQTVKVKFYRENESHKFSYDLQYQDDLFSVMTTSDTRTQDNYMAFSINDAINDTEVDRNKRDIIEVGINLGIKQDITYKEQPAYAYSVPTVWGIPYALDSLGRYQDLSILRHFRLNESGSETIAARLNSGPKADTRTKICVSFLDHVTQAESYFLINNKKYICEKIEYSISDTGVDKIKKGYFFEAES